MARSYLQRLELAARWRLPAAEAREVAEDYREMLAEEPLAEAELEARWGAPAQAVRQLEGPGQYRRWLAAFGSMALCAALPACWLLGQDIRGDWSALLAALGGVFSLVWFRRQGGRRQGPPPRALLVLLACQLLLAGLAGGTLWLAARHWAKLQAAGLIEAGQVGQAVRLALCLAGLGCAALGLLGLAMARLRDRRWQALYLLGLTVLALCAFALSILTSMSLEGPLDAYLPRYLLRAGLTALVGLLGTGAGLC